MGNGAHYRPIFIRQSLFRYINQQVNKIVRSMIARMRYYFWQQNRCPQSIVPEVMVAAMLSLYLVNQVAWSLWCTVFVIVITWQCLEFLKDAVDKICRVSLVLNGGSNRFVEEFDYVRAVRRWHVEDGQLVLGGKIEFFARDVVVS